MTSPRSSRTTRRAGPARQAPALLLLLLLAACASEPPAPRPDPAGPGGRGGPPPGARREGGPPGCARLFVSPSGEPFRARPGDAVCPVAAWFARADADGNGALDAGEFRADALRFFRELDVDGDGVIDGAELARYEHRVLPKMLGGGAFGADPRAEGRLRFLDVALMQPGGGGMGGPPGRGSPDGGRPGGGRPGGDGPGRGEGAPGAGEGVARFGLLGELEPVAAADLDFNGRITAAEFAARADQRFRSLDEAGDGRLTLPALEARLRAAAPGPRRERGGGRHGRRAGGGRVGGGGAPADLRGVPA